MAKIRIEDLKIIFDRIIEKLESENYEYIELSSDYYKIIPTDSWDNIDKDVVEVGSLFDDIKSLLKTVDDKKRPCTYVDFDRISSVLRAISQKNNPA